MNRASRLAWLGALALACGSCAPHPAMMIPPRIDLTQHEMIGVIDFGSPSKGRLGPLVTERFTQSARRDQGLVRIVDCGSSEEALRSLGRSAWDAEAFQQLGRKLGVRTILTGKLTVSRAKPSVSLAPDLRSGGVSKQVNATLSVQLIEAATGASLWSTSAQATQELGNLSVLGGKELYLDAPDPERAYGNLVDNLVEIAANDFHAHWERR
ncbi:MAG TPA: hypothetical protein VJS92_10825 [Candidatus Polarisedimenticolaceae bacterium]|nr:hypothetical protein [Candidatus Polarisedimenticolaceae bacterium]